MWTTSDKDLDGTLNIGSSRRSNQNLQIFGQINVKIVSSRRILQAFQSSRAFVQTFNESTNSKDRIIGTSNQSTNTNDQIIGTSNKPTNPKDWIIWTLNESTKPQDQIIGTLNDSTNPQDWIINTLRDSKNRISMHKPLNTHKNPYPYTQAA